MHFLLPVNVLLHMPGILSLYYQIMFLLLFLLSLFPAQDIFPYTFLQGLSIPLTLPLLFLLLISYSPHIPLPELQMLHSPISDILLILLFLLLPKVPRVNCSFLLLSVLRILLLFLSLLMSALLHLSLLLLLPHLLLQDHCRLLPLVPASRKLHIS